MFRHSRLLEQVVVDLHPIMLCSGFPGHILVRGGDEDGAKGKFIPYTRQGYRGHIVGGKCFPLRVTPL